MNYYQKQVRFPSGSSAVTNLLIINVLVFLGMVINPVANEWMGRHMALWAVDSGAFRPWQLVSYMFLHGTHNMAGRIDIMHIFSNMFALWMFGRIIERSMGTKRFLTYYFACGIGAGLVQLLVYWLSGISMGSTVGASGAVFGLLLAFGMMYPNERIMLLFPPIPMKAKYFVIGYGLLELYFGVSGMQSGVAHFAHLGGLVFGFLLLVLWKKQGKVYY